MAADKEINGALNQFRKSTPSSKPSMALLNITNIKDEVNGHFDRIVGYLERAIAAIESAREDLSDEKDVYRDIHLKGLNTCQRDAELAKQALELLVDIQPPVKKSKQYQSLIPSSVSLQGESLLHAFTAEDDNAHARNRVPAERAALESQESQRFQSKSEDANCQMQALVSEQQNEERMMMARQERLKACQTAYSQQRKAHQRQQVDAAAASSFRLDKTPRAVLSGVQGLQCNHGASQARSSTSLLAFPPHDACVPGSGLALTPALFRQVPMMGTGVAQKSRTMGPVMAGKSSQRECADSENINCARGPDHSVGDVDFEQKTSSTMGGLSKTDYHTHNIKNHIRDSDKNVSGRTELTRGPNPVKANTRTLPSDRIMSSGASTQCMPT
ncbi:MAG: hypothetical protein Q9159_001322 [Coniocarpon cinnabarinum]